MFDDCILNAVVKNIGNPNVKQILKLEKHMIVTYTLPENVFKNLSRIFENVLNSQQCVIPSLRIKATFSLWQMDSMSVTMFRKYTEPWVNETFENKQMYYFNLELPFSVITNQAYFSYGMVSFIAELGGWIGLLLGFRFLTLWDRHIQDRMNATFGCVLYLRDSFTEYNICDTETTPAPIKYSAVGTRFIPPPPPLDLERMKRMQRLKEGYQEISASFKAGPITCLFPCRTTIFEVHRFYREKKKSGSEEKYLIIKKPKDLHSHKNEYIYTIWEFAAEFGGWMGVLSGYSILDISFIIIQAVQHIAQLFLNSIPNIFYNSNK
ncbi:uncharacterized protein LOC111717205 isoform X4 [Eurytemora carolleeae]|uniref:uncharacterized protein LOC111717205 isoform X4 n=1 Tax=Eurytemora carolleeae TaxID=1294199 RepID=UPI000C785694|nr:uncharacterized protein LOC111717205 isoform X4 [Eurytemora carolleeae]|eukprot:XP_023348485.1 uncharacterized protein LOC111717205 isoform X4 [Eurytemora affinis]